MTDVYIGVSSGHIGLRSFQKSLGERDANKAELVYNPGPLNAYKGIKRERETDGESMTKIRIGAGGSYAGRNPKRMAGKMTKIKLAFWNSPPERNNTSGLEHKRKTAPALLVSYYYLEPFLKHKHNYIYRDWALDSGAFSAFNSGVEIDLQAYIDKCLELMEGDDPPVEIYSLDVIARPNDGISYNQAADGTLKNTQLMLDAGIPAIPTYHRYEPEEMLIAIAKDFDKIAIGGLAGHSRKDRDVFIRECFARVWPKKVHGFGLCDEKLLMRFPFHSVDATNWEMGPCAFGRWSSFGKMSVRGSSQNLKAEIEFYLKLERKLRSRWRKEMRRLDATAGISVTNTHPVVRLSERSTGRMKKVK